MRKVSIPSRGNGKGDKVLSSSFLIGYTPFQSPLGEVVKETYNGNYCTNIYLEVSIPSRGSGKGDPAQINGIKMIQVSIPSRGSCKGDFRVWRKLRRNGTFQSPLGEVVKETSHSQDFYHVFHQKFQSPLGEVVKETWSLPALGRGFRKFQSPLGEVVKETLWLLFECRCSSFNPLSGKL